MTPDEWALWAGSLLVIAIVPLTVNRWLDKRKEEKAKKERDQQILTEQSFKTFFDEQILPGLTHLIKSLIADQLRAAHRVSEIGKQEPPPD